MRKVDNIKKYARKGYSTLQNEGIVELGIKSLQKLQKTKQRMSSDPAKKIQFVSLVDRENVMEADWSGNPYKPLQRTAEPPYTINWVMSPPGGGGGHQNIFRFIEFLDQQGHKNNIYLYSTLDDMTIAQAKENVSTYCKAKNLTFRRYKRNEMVSADAIFATGWETAYPVFNEKTDAKKLYFVQDFEPYFYAMGTDYILAENTYKFGFHGITAGGFLKEKLSKEYGMACDSYDFAADEKVYTRTNEGKRKEIFFYARPVTERRGFDLGIMALELFHEAKPEYTINLAGWDVSGYDIPFPYVNHSALKIEDLPVLYNKCAAALVMSLTNMSLLPPELLACGTIPVVNDGPNNRLVSDNPYIAYTEASPASLAKQLINIVEKPDLTAYSKAASESIDRTGWADAKNTFMKVLERELKRG
jgi:glycosyltransferase involved in cell wall biosynthesis